MKNINKIVLLSFVFLFVLFCASTPVAKAAVGEGTATINAGTSVTTPISTSTTFTVVLTVGATGIATDADSPTFTVPAGFTAPDATEEVALVDVDTDGEWFAVGSGGTCAVTMGGAGTSATGQVMTVDVTGACATGNFITLTYKGSAPATAMAATNFDVKTDDASAGGAATSITTTPAHTVVVKGTGVVANHAIAGVATTNNLVGLAATGGTDLVLGGFKITAAGENVAVTTIRTTVTLGTMAIGELTNLRIVPDDGTGAGDPDDGIMHAAELAAPLATIASPVSGNNDFTVTSTVTAGSSKNYFIVGTIAATVSDADTIDVEATGVGSVASGVTSAVAITPTGTSTNSTRTVTDTAAPTLAITLSDDYLTHGETMLVTFTFSEAPTGFSASDVTVESGTLGAIDSSNPLIQTATFTPSETRTTGNVITVGTGWTDSSVGLNPPAGISTSASYTVYTRQSSGSSGSSSGSYTNHSTTTVVASPSVVSTAVVKFTKSISAKSLITDIKNLQLALNTILGNKLAQPLVADGKFGPKSLAAVKAFQAANSLVADGKFGPKSLAKMNTLLGL
jgi:hypothetical protein